jgi:hypothetical protein
MPYTSHGHAYGVIDTDHPRPSLVARCGGPASCPMCKAEAHEGSPVANATNPDAAEEPFGAATFVAQAATWKDPGTAAEASVGAKADRATRMGEAYARRLLVEAAPVTLTAAQVKPWIEFGARLAARSTEPASIWMTAEGITAAAEHVADLKRQVAAACPDPSLHDSLRGYEPRRVAEVEAERDGARAAAREDTRLRLVAEGQVADLRTELLETHADLEASRAREEIALQQVDELERERHELIVERDTLAAQCIDAPAQVILLKRQRDAVLAVLDRAGDEAPGIDREIRAIYAERGDEASGDLDPDDVSLPSLGVHVGTARLKVNPEADHV